MWVLCHRRTFCDSGNICVCIVQHSDSSPPASAWPLLWQYCVRWGESIRGTEMSRVETSNHLEIPSLPWRKQITLPSPIWSVKCFLPAHKDVWTATMWNPNPTLGSPWLLAEPQQISWEKQGQLPPCCDLPGELSSTGNPTTEHKPKMAQL